MLPSRHIITSLSLGTIVGALTDSFLAGVFCFLTGIIIDIDHLLDYAIHFGLRGFNIREFYWTCRRLAKPAEKGGVNKIYLILHAGEIVILLWLAALISKNIYILSIALGYALHLILDAIANAIKPQAYFITMRWLNGFNTIALVKENNISGG
jgi:hypothetical protein